MTAHDRVLLGTDPDRAVLLGDAAHGAREHGRVFDVLCVSEHRDGERHLLFALHLVRLIEDALQFGVAFKHATVEVRREFEAVFFEEGNRGLDESDLIGGKHVEFLRLRACGASGAAETREISGGLNRGPNIDRKNITLNLHFAYNFF